MQYMDLITKIKQRTGIQHLQKIKVSNFCNAKSTNLIFHTVSKQIIPQLYLRQIKLNWESYINQLDTNYCILYLCIHLFYLFLLRGADDWSLSQQLWALDEEHLEYYIIKEATFIDCLSCTAQPIIQLPHWFYFNNCITADSYTIVPHVYTNNKHTFGQI